MGLFKNKDVERRKLKASEEKVSLTFDSGISDLSQNTTCELAILGSQMIINPLFGPERKITLDISNINSIDVITWGEYARKYQHTNISISKNATDRTYFVINYTSSNGSVGYISFWGVTMHWLKLRRFAEYVEGKLPPKVVHL